MTAPDQDIDIEEVVRVLVSVGVDEPYARDQFAGLETDADRLAEVCALTLESDAGIVLSAAMPPAHALFDLVEGLRQAGLSIALAQTEAGGFGLSLGGTGGTPPSRYELELDPGAPLIDLVCAVASVVPRAHQVLLAREYEVSDALAIAVFDRGSYVWFSAAVGDGGLEELFTRAASDAPGARMRPGAALREPDFVERFGWHAPQPETAESLEACFERVRAYDPRVPWPAHSRRPPGDDFYELCGALAAAPLSRCLSERDDHAFATLLYEFAFSTLVGASCDLLAARHNPGMSAQGVLGFGQLTWAWFIFEALGASEEAARVGALLDDPWVSSQERGRVAARQRAYFDLALLLRTGRRGSSLMRLFEHVALLDPERWSQPQAVRDALAAHTEPVGDQLTHHPLYHAWPAPLYALARRAHALEQLPADNPFLAHPLHRDQVDLAHPHLVRLAEQLAGFDALDPSRLPPLLDPLPVIIDVCVTEVNGVEAQGHTLLCAHDEAEHRVSAPHAGRPVQPGEVWLFEVQGSQPATRDVQVPELGTVATSIALPTGEWLSKA